MVPSPENVVPLGWLWRFAPLGPESRDNLIRGTGLLRRRDGHVLPQGVLGPWTHDSVDGSGIISGFREGFLKFSDVLRPRRARAANLRCLRILCESHLRRYRRKQNQHQTHDSSTCDVVMAHGDYLLAHAGCIVGASDPRDRVALTSWTVAESRAATASTALSQCCVIWMRIERLWVPAPRVGIDREDVPASVEPSACSASIGQGHRVLTPAQSRGSRAPVGRARR